MASVALIWVGVGHIGQYWLDHIAQHWPRNHPLELRALVSSQRYFEVNAELTWRSAQPLTALFARRAHQCSHPEQQVTACITALKQDYAGVIVIDATASKAVSRCYVDWLQAGADIVSANKYAGSSASDYYQEIHQTLKNTGRYWRASATIGAGLPVQDVLRDKYQQQAPVSGITGTFSGSLAWIFHHYRAGEPLSKWLLKAVDLGLTEPDPRADLSGMDVARKLLIVARELGWQLELPQIAIQNLVPPALREVSLDEFWRRIDEFDHYFERWRQQTYPSATRLVYLGRVRQTAAGEPQAVAQIEPQSAESVYAELADTEAYFELFEQDMTAPSVIIRGPGTGADATTQGIQRDIDMIAAKIMTHATDPENQQ
ncbi:hypothetical protein [Pseudidiomarina taiwanensis]|uniref:homoserine dehydrogenase n=1 Tax=Pseudidiomarina taiwanensis TaxID=337250 RepID=A0A432ZFL1_9GAMM|nr:hypothetical protein [Pseudidiomarina taiwanensis]RUO76757.1 hypothetical protein CWI83_07485 [Pseudidiomarina taiwanensis]